MIPRSCRPGLSLVEALISLSITATLLVALAAAFHASAHVVEANDSYFRCTQTARLTLGQILTEIRRADAVQVDPSGSRLQIIRPADQLTAREIYRQYTFDRVARRISLQILYAENARGEAFELANNVTACEFVPANAPLDDGDTSTSPCISISLTCSDGVSSVILAGSAIPRRAAYNHRP